jgi:hypothetical protein
MEITPKKIENNLIPLSELRTIPTDEPQPNYPSTMVAENENKTLASGEWKSSNYIPNTAGWKLTPNSGEFNFNISVDSIDIPDTTTINSFHTDINGNSWWGATTLANAVAKVLSTGVATFKNILIGGADLQYQVTNAGIFSFGDASDGNLTTSGNLTLTSDKYYNNLTVAAGHTLNPGGYRIFVQNTLTVNGTIARSGANGTNGTSATNSTGAAAGGGGAALADGYLKGSLAGATGGNGGNGASIASSPGSTGSNSTGSNTTNSIGGSGADGGDGGDTAYPSGPVLGGSSTPGTATASNVKLIANWHLATLLDIGATGSTVKFDNSASSSGGGGGAGGGLGAGTGSNSGGGGGGAGAGSSGGIVAIYAKTIVVDATGIIQANGGSGGNGGNGANANGTLGQAAEGGAGGGGGAGGNGGQIILVYNSLTNNGTIQANGGTAGTRGNGGTGYGGGPTGGNGDDGVAGSAGTIRQFLISL